MQKKNQYECNSNPYSTRINVNSCHWNTCKFVFIATRTQQPGLIPVSMSMQPYCRFEIVVAVLFTGQTALPVTQHTGVWNRN